MDFSRGGGVSHVTQGKLVQCVTGTVKCQVSQKGDWHSVSQRRWIVTGHTRETGIVCHGGGRVSRVTKGRLTKGVTEAVECHVSHKGDWCSMSQRQWSVTCYTRETGTVCHRGSGVSHFTQGRLVQCVTEAVECHMLHKGDWYSVSRRWWSVTHHTRETGTVCHRGSGVSHVAQGRLVQCVTEAVECHRVCHRGSGVSNVTHGRRVQCVTEAVERHMLHKGDWYSVSRRQ